MSSSRTETLQISRRYATAIFDLARDAKKQAIVVGEMQALAAAMLGNAALKEALSSPLVTPAQKAATLAALMTSADSLTRRSVEIIAVGNRAEVIPAIADGLARMLAEEQGALEARVTSARTLNAATQKQLASALAQATGKKVSLALTEDANMLGGLMIEVGSLRLDATLSGALNHMRQALLSNYESRITNH